MKVAEEDVDFTSPVHPFDPLSDTEIKKAVQIIKSQHGDLHYNAVTLQEPPKTQMLEWLADPRSATKPARIADVVVIAAGGKVYDGLVDVETGKIVNWETMHGVQPLVSVLRRFGLKLSLTAVDYNGGTKNCGTCLSERSKGH